MADIPSTNKSTVEEEPMLGPGHRGLLSPPWCTSGIPTAVNAFERASTPNQQGSLARALKTEAEETGDVPKPSKKGEPQRKQCTTPRQEKKTSTKGAKNEDKRNGPTTVVGDVSGVGPTTDWSLPERPRQ
ncbi:hypothetical protein GOBAR_DD22889 [Gossypium barbadense]|nr:hypothetical protein GOBAR_DD22889 [Gossypium barbadense]